MKVLVTGHRGYIGVEMVPELVAAGHEVVGLDTGYYDECDFVSPPDDIPELKLDLRDVEPDHLRGFDAVAHLGALVERPAGKYQPQPDIRHQPARVGALGGGSQGGRRRTVPVLVVLQPVRRGW